MKKRIQDIWIKEVKTAKLSANASYLALALYQYSNNDTGICFPSFNNLHEDFGITRTVFYKGKEELVEAGLLEYQKGNSKRANTYRLTFNSVKSDILNSAKYDTPTTYSTTYIKDRDTLEDVVVIEDYPEPGINPDGSPRF